MVKRESYKFLRVIAFATRFGFTSRSRLIFLALNRKCGPTASLRVITRMNRQWFDDACSGTRGIAYLEERPEGVPHMERMWLLAVGMVNAPSNHR